MSFPARSDSAAPGPGQRVAAWAVACLVLALGAKAALLPFAVSDAGSFLRWVLRLGLVVAQDFCFVLAVAHLAWFTLALAGRGPAARGVAWFWHGVFYLLGAYLLAGVGIYRWAMVPLELRHLWLTGGSMVVVSSLASATGWFQSALVLLGPWLAYQLAWLAVRRLAAVPWPRRYLLAALATAAWAAWVSQQYIQHNWRDPNRWERRIAQSAPWVMVRSCFQELGREDLLQRLHASPAGSRQGANLPPPRRAVSVAELSEDARPRNVLVLVLESVGAEYLSLYGSPHRTTPCLERLAARYGVVFERCYVTAPSSCKSLYSLLSGRYPRCDWGLVLRDQPRLPVPTLFDLLHRDGYRTLAAHSGYWSWKARDRFLQAHGVECVLDARTLAARRLNSWGVEDRAMLQAVLDWIDRQPQRPFAALAYTIQTHHPYVVQSDRAPEFVPEDPTLNRYLRSVWEADRLIAWLVEQLRRRGLWEQTLLVVTADHGESFGQHGQRIHSFALYEPAVRVPLVLLWPGWSRPGKRLAHPVQQVDLLPTLLQLLGRPVPADLDGWHLWAAEPRRVVPLVATGNGIIFGARQGQWKYHYHLESDREELYRLDDDPGERHNLASEYPRRCARLRRAALGLLLPRHRQTVAAAPEPAVRESK